MTAFPHFVTLNTPDGPMSTYVSTPEGEGTHPAVLVIQGQGGISSFELKVAERLAGHGYVAAVPDLFHRLSGVRSREEQAERRTHMSDPKVLADCNAVIAHLKSQPSVQGDGIGIAGFCMGGRVSYLMATASPDIKVAADFYGGGTLKGEDGPAPFDMTKNIRCPVIVIDGEEDAHPSPDEVRKIGAELARNGVTHEVHILPRVGHGFMAGSKSPDIIEQAWSLWLGWFDKHLVREPVGAGR